VDVSFDIPLAETLVSSLYQGSGLNVPVASTIVCSLAPLIREQPAQTPALTSFVTSPAFPPEHGITTAAWAMTWDVVPDQGKPFELLQHKSLIAVQKNRLFLDLEPTIRAGVTVLPGGLKKSIKQADRESEVARMILEIVREWAQRFTVGELLDKASAGYFAGLPRYIVTEFKQQVRDEPRAKRRPSNPLESLDGPTPETGEPLLELIADAGQSGEMIELIEKTALAKAWAKKRMGPSGEMMIDLLLHGLSQKEVAAALRCSIPTIKRRQADLRGRRRTE